MVDGQGLEPRMPEAPDLQSGAVTCSARHPLERGKGIEPSASAWKAEVLPLYEPRMVHHQIVKERIKNPGVFSSRVSVDRYLQQFYRDPPQSQP